MLMYPALTGADLITSSGGTAMRNRFALAASILALVFTTGGCASSGTSASTETAAATGPANTITIVVDNNLSGLKAATVSITRESSGLRRLGQVESGRKTTYTYSGANGNYTLTARTSTATDDPIVSQVFQVTGNMKVTWHLRENSLIPE
jgi:hypothetical protein